MRITILIVSMSMLLTHGLASAAETTPTTVRMNQANEARAKLRDLSRGYQQKFKPSRSLFGRKPDAPSQQELKDQQNYSLIAQHAANLDVLSRKQASDGYTASQHVMITNEVGIDGTGMAHELTTGGRLHGYIRGEAQTHNLDGWTSSKTSKRLQRVADAIRRGDPVVTRGGSILGSVKD
jgi:hypothetical protein